MKTTIKPREAAIHHEASELGHCELFRMIEIPGGEERRCEDNDPDNGPWCVLMVIPEPKRYKMAREDAGKKRINGKPWVFAVCLGCERVRHINPAQPVERLYPVELVLTLDDPD